MAHAHRGGEDGVPFRAAVGEGDVAELRARPPGQLEVGVQPDRFGGDGAQHRGAAVYGPGVVREEPGAGRAAHPVGGDHQIDSGGPGRVEGARHPRAQAARREGLAQQAVEVGARDARHGGAEGAFQRGTVHPGQPPPVGGAGPAGVLGACGLADGRAHAQGVQGPDSVGGERDAGAGVGQDGGPLQHGHLPAGAVQSDRGGEAAHAAADHQGRAVHDHPPFLQM